MSDAINHLSRITSSERQIAAVINNVRLLLPQIGQHSVEGRQVAVNIGDNGGAHGFRQLAVQFQFHSKAKHKVPHPYAGADANAPAFTGFGMTTSVVGKLIFTCNFKLHHEPIT
jgi:hypothetical protein